MLYSAKAAIMGAGNRCYVPASREVKKQDCKDLSRLGRDYIEAGRFTDIVFPSMGCRFIALNDGVDTIHKNNEMLVILKNVMKNTRHLGGVNC